MYHFKDKTISGLNYEIFAERDNLFFGRVEYAPKQWDAVSWSQNGITLGENSKQEYNLHTNKFFQTKEHLEGNCVHSLEALTFEYFKANDENKQRIFEKIKRHNKRVREDSSNNYYKTVGVLKEALKNVPDHFILGYQRVTDNCFKPNSGWTENNFILPFNHKDDWDSYLKVFNCSARPDEEVFIFEAHY